MLLTKVVPLKIINFNVDMYKDKGYNCKIGDIVDIKVEDVSKHSKSFIKIACDKCGEEKEVTIETYNNANIYKGEYLCNICLKESMNNRRCEVCGSNIGVTDYLNQGKYICSKHQKQIKKYGMIKRSSKDSNEIRIYDEYAEFDTYNAKCEINGTFKIDLDIVDFIKTHKLHKHDGYACYKKKIDDGRVINIRLHRYIMGLEDNANEKIVDHINRDRSDDRKCNLRIVTNEQNNRNVGMYSHNTSGHKGISWNKDHNGWEVYIHQYNKKINLSIYTDLERAIQVREIAEIVYFGKDSPRYEELIHKYIGNKLIEEIILKKQSNIKEDK